MKSLTNKIYTFSQFIIVLGTALFLQGCKEGAIVLNDVHSKLNATTVLEAIYPENVGDVVHAVRKAKQLGVPISISGGRHAMGGQQFAKDSLHISMTKMNDVLSFDRDRGIVRVEAGIEWPKLLKFLQDEQKHDWPQWGILQKQTGADRLSIGGALSANAHGRGVKFKPIIQDVESFTLVNAQGQVLNVSRTENKSLFNLVIGGYGLFGVIATVDLKLQPRVKLQRVVEVIPIDELPAKAQARIEEGFLYGDFQYKTDSKARDFMKVGVFSTYRPVPIETPIAEDQKRLTADKWNNFILLAHTDKAKAFELYSDYYLSTDKQVYWSDSLQLSYYNDAYEEYLKTAIPDYREGSLMISEVYVPRDRVNDFINQVADDALTHDFDIIYGTMRLIKKDDESFLAWAKSDYACVIFNLRVDHSMRGIKKAKENFQRIIDRALSFDGSYFLTYHRWARKNQVLQAYPQFVDFLKLKRKYDPHERFQSEWYRHYREMFADELSH